MNAIAPVQQFTAEKAAAIAEAVLIRGDLADLTPEERAKYCVRVCQSVGLNPLTRPFEYITLNGKLTLYARKDATDQLRAIYKISVTDLIETEREGVFVVTAKVANSDGRTDAAKGAVTIIGLKGDALANAMMKAETKAKRRATLSICGLGMLDETELETIPASAKFPTAKARVAAIAELPEAERETAADRMHEEDAERMAKGLRNAMQARPAPMTEAEHARALETFRAKGRKKPAVEHDADGVVWEEDGERPATAADFEGDGLDIPPQFDRRKKSPKDTMISEIESLNTPREILHFGLAMSASPSFSELSKEDRGAIHVALERRQKTIMGEVA